MKLVNNTGQESERNLCFVNTALQLLHSIPRVRRFFKMREYRLPSEQKRQMKICDEVSRLFNANENFTLSAAELRLLVAMRSGRLYLKDGSQQDTVEFLVTLLTEVEHEISANNWEAKTVVQEFWGVEKNEKKFLTTSGICSKCKSGPRQEVEKSQVLQVDIPETNRVLTLNGILENYFSESSETAKMRCNCCTHKTNCPETGVCKPKAFVSKKVIIKSPDILVVQVNRYSNETGAKILTTLWPDETIRLPSGDEFKLCGIGHHLGKSFNSGHYLASVCPDTEWIRCNDTQIEITNESDSKSLECNICIYTKLFNSTTPFNPTDEWQNIKGRQVPGGLHYSFGLMGNYARNLNLGEGSFVRDKNIPTTATTKQECRKEVKLDRTEFKDKDDWITPSKNRGFSRKSGQFATNEQSKKLVSKTKADTGLTTDDLQRAKLETFLTK